MDSNDIELKIIRNAVNDKFLEEYLFKEKLELTTKQKITNTFNSTKNRLKNTTKQDVLRILKYRLPIFKWVLEYNIRHNLKFDILSGFTVATMQISQGLAYGALTTLEPIVGLYCLLIPPFLYAIFGSSNFIHFGTVNINSLVTASMLTDNLVSNYIANKTIVVNGNQVPMDELYGKYIITCTFTLTIGICYLILFVIKAKIISYFLSSTVVDAFTFAAAFQAFVSQLGAIFGISVPRSFLKGELFKTPLRFYYYISHLNQTNIASLVTSLISISFLLVFRYTKKYTDKFLHFPIPSEFILTAIAIIAVYFGNLHTKFNLPIVGKIPKGLPQPILPDLSIIPSLFGTVITSVILTYSICMSVGQTLALKNKQSFNPGQELFAIGITSVISSFFRCPPPGVSLSRSVLHAGIGVTQLFSIISCIIMLFVLLFASVAFEYLPNALLSSIVIVVLIPIYEGVFLIKRFWRFNKVELVIWISTALTSLVFKLEYGLFLGIIITNFLIALRIINGAFIKLGNIKDTEIYKSQKMFQTNDKHKVSFYSYNMPICHLNERLFFKKFSKIITLKSQSVTVNTSLDNTTIQTDDERVYKSVIILDLSFVNFIDLSGGQAIVKIINISKLSNVNLLIVGLKETIKYKLGYMDSNIFFPTIQDAVIHANQLIKE